ncbi:nuclear transport factor 2 family protein [Chamaesiphon sp.]|uniref:nuclear transport factor 2 family protein n=1 Tax=Chamaesiphon sp. TaxID=2814140 RepID=UPI0035943258
MILSTKSSSILTVLISAAIVAVTPAQADVKSKVQPIIQTNYNQINAAFIRKDIKGATALFTADYISINPDGGKQTLTEFREHYNNLFTRFNIQLTSNKATIKAIDTNTGGIDVAIDQKTEGTIAGFNKIVINQTSRDSWLKTPQGWRLKQSKILNSQTTFNGQTFKG